MIYSEKYGCYGIFRAWRKHPKTGQILWARNYVFTFRNLKRQRVRAIFKSNLPNLFRYIINSFALDVKGDVFIKHSHGKRTQKLNNFA